MDPAPHPSAGPGLAARLQRERGLAAERLGAMQDDVEAMIAASLDSNADDEHDPEGATIAFERAQLSSLAERTRRQLSEIDGAISRVAAGTYGRCQACDQPIGDTRLEARPSARTCIGCALRAEAGTSRS